MCDIKKSKPLSHGFMKEVVYKVDNNGGLTTKIRRSNEKKQLNLS